MSISVTIDGLDTEVDVSLVPSATEISPESYVALRGLKGDKGDDGVVGRDGIDGKDGVGITSITQNLDGTLSINLDDGSSYETEPLKGEKGDKGDKGDAGDVDTAMSGSSSLPVQNKVIKAYVDGGLSTKADVTSLPTKISDLTNDAGYITGYTETDPTVPSWAKASSKPSYTASEVGALPDTTVIPSKVSDLTNDAGYITSESDTTYTLTKSGNTITLTGSDGSTTSVTDANTTYSTMTRAQATAGTSTSGYRISPKVLHDTIQNSLPTVPSALSDLTNDMTVSDFTNDAGYLTSYTETGNVEFDTSASTGTTDGDLYALLTDWGWTDCIV